MVIDGICIIMLILALGSMILVLGIKELGTRITTVIFVSVVPIHIIHIAESLGSVTDLSWTQSCRVMDTLLLPALWILVCKETKSWYHVPICLHFLFSVLYLLMILLFLTENMQISGERIGTLRFIHKTILLCQGVIYIPVMIWFAELLRSPENNPASNSALLASFIHVFSLLFVVVVAGYLLDADSIDWSIPLSEMILILNLVYRFILKSALSPCLRKSQEPYIRSSLTEDEMKRHCECIMAYLRESEAYKRHNLSIWQVSKVTRIPRATISQSLNVYLGKNFLTLVNEMRVEEAKKILCSKQAESFTIESIAYDSGFQSRSTFYQAFNKSEGISPARWIKLHVQQQIR